MAVTLTGASDRYLDVNETFEQITGWRRDEVIGRTRYEIGICVDSAYRVEFAKRILNDGAVRNMEVNFHCKDGTEKIGLSSAEIIEIEGEPCILSVIADITERRRLEEAQRQSEERLHLAVQAGKMYAYEWDAKTGVVIRSPECADVLGPDQPIQTTFQDVMAQIHPEDRIGVDEPGSGLTPEDPTRQVSYRLLRPDGGVLWLEKSARAFFDDQGKLRRTVGVVADITERKHAEEALRSSEERFRRVVENIGDALVVDDVAGHVVFVNDRFLSLFGFRREQLPSLKLEDSVAPEYRAALCDWRDRRMREESVPSHFEYEGIRPDGKRMWLEVDVVPIADPTGKLVGTQSAVRDITERKQAENAVHESEERFRLVANTAPVMIWMSGIDKLCTYFNKPWLEFVGRSFEDELGDGWASGVHPDDLDNCLNAYSEAFDRAEPFEIYYRLRRHDGEYRWILDTGVPRFSADGTFAGYIGSCLDITERKLAEEAMASVSRRLIEAHEQERTWVARELHDDINQQIALLSIELDRYAQRLPESAADLQGEIRHLSKRLSDIANGVQALSHRLHSSKLEYLGLTTAAKSFCKELSEQQNIRVEFNHFDVPPNIPQEIALCLFRVLQEALQNAVKHSGTRQFRVELRGTHEEIRLTVSDPGVGFDCQGALDRHGLGLISMRERLLLVNGEFAVKSRLGAGTTVCARIPLKQAEHRAMAG
jgi:PAS domain S-box-containing protein